VATRGQVTIGWLEDNIGYTGGAEMSGAALRAAAPDWVREIIPCPPNKRPPTDEIDLFYIANQTTYDARWAEELALKPIVKQVRDPWYSGSAQLRRWLLEASELLIFSSQVQVDAFDYPFNGPYEIVPVPLDLQPFRDAALPPGERHGNVFVGRCDVFKGAHAAVDWALRNLEPLDLYGAAGCELVTKGRIGALEWIENRPEDLERGAEMFWDAVKDVVL